MDEVQEYELTHDTTRDLIGDCIGTVDDETEAVIERETRSYVEATDEERFAQVPLNDDDDVVEEPDNNYEDGEVILSPTGLVRSCRRPLRT